MGTGQEFISYGSINEKVHITRFKKIISLIEKRKEILE